LLDLERLAPTPQFEHHFLGDLLGHGALANDGLSHSHEVCVVGPEDSIESAFVTCPNSLL